MYAIFTSLRITLLSKCEHGDISPKEWLTPGSSAYNVISKIVKDNLLLSDLQYFTEFSHNGNLEVFHSVIKVLPKTAALQ